MKNELADNFSRRIEETLSFPEWRRWFWLLASLSAVLVGSYFAGGADWGLYVVLTALGAFALYANYRDVREIDREIKLASGDARLLVECNDIALFLDRTHGGEQAAGAGRSSYFRSHIEALYKIYCVSSEIHQDNLVEILHSRLLARNRRIELHASILITIGLIGTVVGLLIMMGELKAAVNDSGFGSSGNVLRELMGDHGPLKGLATAFLTTLLAAGFGGVILRILTSIVEEGISKYVALLSELTEIHVLPMLRSHAAEMERRGGAWEEGA